MNEVYYIGIICIGILAIQSKAIFTWEHLGILLVTTGTILLIKQQIEQNKQEHNLKEKKKKETNR